MQDLISNETLLQAVKEDYLTGNYETSITKAFKYLEETILSGSSLKDPKPDDLDLRTAEELKAARFKMKGAMHWFKEPGNHHLQNYNPEDTAAKILAYVDLQINMLSVKEN